MVHVPAYIAGLVPYEPGKSIAELRRATGATDIIKLASNENPLGPSPKARAAMLAALDDLHRYPDGGGALKAALADRYGIRPENVVLAGGSDSLMMAIVRAFVTPGGEVVTSAGSFLQYLLMPKAQGAVVKAAPLKNYHYDLEAIAALVTARTQLVFLANPNNPTGTIFSRTEWDAFYRSVPSDTLIVLDEAYAEFVHELPEWPDSMAYRYDNVLTLRTFSKAYGLAGVRLGYGFGHADWIRELHKVKLPFEPSSLALAAGEAALDDTAFVQQYLQLVREGRRYFEERFTAMGIAYAPSAANFVMACFPDAATATQIHAALLAEGIIVRPLKAFGLPEAVRITIGLPEENKRCMDGIATIMRR